VETETAVTQAPLMAYEVPEVLEAIDAAGGGDDAVQEVVDVVMDSLEAAGADAKAAAAAAAAAAAVAPAVPPAISQMLRFDPTVGASGAFVIVSAEQAAQVRVPGCDDPKPVESVGRGKCIGGRGVMSALRRASCRPHTSYAHLE
jgi:hypothetical protein